MKNLISMVDFVLYRHLKRKSCINDTYDYARFLKQPLELWMFVPCILENEFANWQPMKEPSKEIWDKFINSELGSFDDSYTYCLEYQQGKERCLFEGFKLDGKYLFLKDSLYMISDNYNETFKKNGDIESLLNKYPSLRPTLTPTAQKQFQP